MYDFINTLQRYSMGKQFITFIDIIKYNLFIVFKYFILYLGCHMIYVVSVLIWCTILNWAVMIWFTTTVSYKTEDASKPFSGSENWWNDKNICEGCVRQASDHGVKVCNRCIIKFPNLRQSLTLSLAVTPLKNIYHGKSVSLLTLSLNIWFPSQAIDPRTKG